MADPTITSWTGTVTDIGPMYPFAGYEFPLVLLAFAFWIGWHVLQLRAESAEYDEDAAELRVKGAMQHALEREG